MSNYKCIRYRYVTSLEDMQLIYEIAERYTTIMKTDKEYRYSGVGTLKYISYVQDGDRYYKITSRWIKDIEDKKGKTKYVDVFDVGEEKYACTWIFDKTGEDRARIHPSRVSRIYNAVYKPDKIIGTNEDIFDRDEHGRIIQSAKPILGYNKKFDKTEHPVVVYDLNSAYAMALVDKIIDTYNPRYCDFVGENEVGFFSSDINLKIRHKGEYADVVFPLIESPYKDFARKYYEIKKTAPKGSDERELAKQILVITVGLWQNVNPYLRAYVIGKCNEYIEYFLKKYKDKICMWNTDALYCTEHIEELDNLIGDDIGQFKIEYEGMFRQKGCNYQKLDLEEHKTSYRGKSKILFKDEYNILTDRLPTCVMPYKMDKETLEIKVNKEYNNGETI